MAEPAPALTKRTVLIAGASSGLGAHLAATVARAGANVGLGAWRAGLRGSLAGPIEAAGGATAASFTIDDGQLCNLDRLT